jgi:hypothetical protein
VRPGPGPHRPVARASTPGDWLWGMRITSMTGSAVAGLQAASERLSLPSPAVPVDRVSVTDDLANVADRITAVYSFRANAKSLETWSQVSNELMDLLRR